VRKICSGQSDGRTPHEPNKGNSVKLNLATEPLWHLRSQAKAEGGSVSRERQSTVKKTAKRKRGEMGFLESYVYLGTISGGTQCRLPSAGGSAKELSMAKCMGSMQEAAER